AQQVFIHVSDSLFTQFRTLPQAMRPSLELRSAAFQQYSAKPTRAIHVIPCLLCANIEYKVNLTYLITPFGCPAMQAFIKSGFIQVKHAYPLVHLANSWYLCKNFPVVCCLSTPLMAPTRSILCNYKKTEKALFCPSIVVAPPYPVKFACSSTYGLPQVAFMQRLCLCMYLFCSFCAF